MFGSMAMNPTLVERKSSDITMKMTTSAVVTLFTCPHTTSSVVPFKRMMLPVGVSGTSGGWCSAAQVRMRSTAAEISVERSKRVRTNTLACPKSALITERNVLGLCLTKVSTSSSRRGSSQKLFTCEGSIGFPSSSRMTSPLDRNPLSSRSR